MTCPNTQLFIDGQWQDAADDRMLPVFNPATDQEIGRVAHASQSEMGLLANPRWLTAMAELVQDTENLGATVLAGGKRIGEDGNFWSPTVLSNVPLDAAIYEANGKVVKDTNIKAQ